MCWCTKCNIPCKQIGYANCSVIVVCNCSNGDAGTSGIPINWNLLTYPKPNNWDEKTYQFYKNIWIESLKTAM
jgi:hypothetical protein